MENGLNPRKTEIPPPPNSSPNTINSGNGVFRPPATPTSNPSAAASLTFIHANSSSFKQVVQMLTGASSKNPISPPARPICPKKPAFKLYERRRSMKDLKMISPKISGENPPEFLSPSVLDVPPLVISPVTPLISDTFGGSPEIGSAEAVKAEERAIADKGFYFHPLPEKTELPELLPLFPMAAAGVSSASAP